MDLSAISHLATLESRIPFVNIFDGFRTSHEIQKVELMEMESLLPLVPQDAVKRFRDQALNPNKPVTRGTAQNDDIYFQSREAANKFHDAVPEIVEKYLAEINKITGRNYGLFDYYGAEDADRVIIAMGSVTETIKETIDFLRAKGEKVGLLAVHLYRPFKAEAFLKLMPKTATRICVLDRTKEPGASWTTSIPRCKRYILRSRKSSYDRRW